jgi:hypothetical protein
MVRVLSTVSVSAGRILGLTLASLVLGAGVGSQPSAADDVLVISPQVFEYYEKTYLKNKRPGAMAVSADGLSAGYSYCPDYRCKLNPSARNRALRSCTKAGGRDCQIFAVGRDIVTEYRIDGSLGGNALAMDAVLDAMRDASKPRYGAFAYSKTTNLFGTAAKMDSAAKARERAIERCNADDCEIVVEFGPLSCAAYGIGTVGGAYAAENTEFATKRALSARCSALPDGCYVTETMCN